MTDNENILIEDFFKQAARQQIEDDGFTERVMASLPEHEASRTHKLSRLWTWFCVIVGLLLFLVFGGMATLEASLHALLVTALTSLKVFVTTAPTADVHLNPVAILMAFVFVGVFLPYQTYRKLSATL